MKLHCADDLANARNDFVAPVKYADVHIDDMKPKMWKKMTDAQRKQWYDHWWRLGVGSYKCMDCEFPIAYGWAPCECCEPKEFKELK